MSTPASKTPNRMLSVVVPLLNEEANLHPLYEELLSVFKGLVYFNTYEIIFVNDGSKDNSLVLLKNLAKNDAWVKVVSFTRNFGHEYATYAGILHAQGDAVVLIDADRQDPAELIIDFEREFCNGYDIVCGQRSKRLSESFLKKLTSKAFYPFFKRVTGVDIPPNVGDFCLLSRKAVTFMKNFSEKTIFVRGLIYWTGLPKKTIPFVRRGRNAGKSKYNYTKLTMFALENIISFSIVPIYFIIFSSLIVILGCLISSAVALGMYILGYVVMTGWTSLMMCMLFLFATTFFFLGLLGLYIGKIFQEIKNRPRFLIDELVNIAPQKESLAHVQPAWRLQEKE